MVIPAIEPSHLEFPPDTIYIRNTDMTLQRITSANDKRLLWPNHPEQEPEEEPPTIGVAVGPKVVSQDQIDCMVQARLQGTTIVQIAKDMGLNKSTVTRHLRIRRQNQGSNHNMTIQKIQADFSAIENTEIPYSVRNAIQLALGTANTMAALSEERIIQAHYQGYIAGFHSALAIICGSAGISLEFLEEKE